MRSTLLRTVTAVAVWVLSAAAASAHEHQTFTIGGAAYQFVVGSVGEPAIVDTVSGVELTVTQAGSASTRSADGDMDGPSGGPVAGLEKTLQVEISAGGKSKTLALEAQHGKPGAYVATFIPTVQTTFRYRFFGTVNGTPVDLSFTCNPAGHAVTPDEKTPVKLSDTVTRTLKGGAFGCPLGKADLGFPEPSATLYDISQAGNGTSGMIGAVSGVLALILSAWAWVRAGKRIA